MGQIYKSKEIITDVLKKIESNAEVIVFDFETSGFSPSKARIIQVSGLRINLKTFQIVDEINLYINPGFYITSKITEVTGITNELLQDKPSEEETFPSIYEFFGNGEILLCGYNSNRFDIPFLNNLYQRYGKDVSFNNSIDVYLMASAYLNSSQVPDFKLGTVTTYFGFDKNLSFHNSKDDALATFMIMKKFINLFLAEKEAANSMEILKPQNKPRAGIYSMQFWDGFKGRSRIYVNTNYGTLFYDIVAKEWRDKDDGCMNSIDMKQLINDCYKLAHVSSQSDFGKARIFG